MRRTPRILVDQSHRQAWTCDLELAAKMNPANPADSSYFLVAEAARKDGFQLVVNQSAAITAELLRDIDVFVLPHASEDDWEKTVGYGSPKLTDAEISALEEFVLSGGGLLILGETEQQKYGNNFAELAMRFGVKISNATVQDPVQNHNAVASWPKPVLPRLVRSDLNFKVKNLSLYRAATLELLSAENAEVFLSTSEHALPASAPLAAALWRGQGRVVVLADSDLFGDDSVADGDNIQLWLNVVGFLSNAKAAKRSGSGKPESWASSNLDWQRLVKAVEELRPLQLKDGSIDFETAELAQVDGLVDDVLTAVNALSEHFPHQARYIEALNKDIASWREGGYKVPDFYDSLQEFRPDQIRKDGLEHLVVFSMYTQNGNPNRNLEAVITNTFWPDWLAQKEQKYQNPAFIPIEFVAFTAGYDTNSAVLFPETVAVREVATYFWGGIFCDREAARFRKVTDSARELLYLALPADAERLILDQRLAQETFVLWDLIHDRTHSRGDLPFDPFMIKQRMPFWMYALEELRCDLSTFRETVVLDEEGDPLAKYIRYAILFDRLFRFPITGNRVRNYDGLGGQIIFAHLHKKGALHWTDNRLTFDWDLVVPSVIELCEQVESLYHEGINRSRLAQWIAAYEFVKELVPPHPASNWAKGADQLPTGGELKEVVNLVLDDEFPLNVFYETLNRKLSDVVASTKGIAA